MYIYIRSLKIYYKDSAETETIISIWNLDEPQVFERELQV